MKRILLTAATFALFGFSAAVLADPPHDDHGRDDNHGHDNRDDHHHETFRRGDRVPDHYRGHEQYYVSDYHRYHLHEPRPGYRWVRSDDGQFLLVAAATGVIAEIIANSN